MTGSHCTSRFLRRHPGRRRNRAARLALDPNRKLKARLRLATNQPRYDARVRADHRRERALGDLLRREILHELQHEPCNAQCATACQARRCMRRICHVAPQARILCP